MAAECTESFRCLNLSITRCAVFELSAASISARGLYVFQRCAYRPSGYKEAAGTAGLSSVVVFVDCEDVCVGCVGASLEGLMVVVYVSGLSFFR